MFTTRFSLRLSPRAHTIVLVTLDGIARVDLRSGRPGGTAPVEVVHVARAPRSAQGELHDAVGAAMGLGSAPGDRVIVLTDELWSGHVSLANEILAAITDEQLEQSLAIEAEYESGYSPFESRLGHASATPEDGRTTWWVTQADAEQVDAIRAAMPEGPEQLAAISTTTLAPHRPLGQDPSAPEPVGEGVLEITSAESCATFARAWLTQYHADRRALAVIDLTSPGWTPAKQRRVGLLAAAGVFTVCFALHFTGAARLADAHAERLQLVDRETELRATLQEGEHLARRIQEVKHQRETARQARAEQIESRRREHAAYVASRERPVQLLDALAATAHPGHWIQNIDFRDDQVVISGVAVDSTSVTTLAQRLEAELDASLWSVRAAEMSNIESIGLVRFEMVLVPLKPIALPSNVARRGAADVR